MKKLFSIAVAALISAGVYASGVCEVKKGEVIPGLTEYTLSNGVISLKCIPEASGMFSGFCDIASRREMIDPPECKLVTDDLLPRRISFPGAKTGIRETARGVKVEYFTDYRVQKTSADAAQTVLEMYSRSYYSRDIAVTKTIGMKRGEALAKIVLKFTPHSNDGKALLLWINGIASLGKSRDTVLMPVDGRVKMRGGRSLTNIAPEAGIYAADSLEYHDVYLAPDAPWIARVSPERPGVMVMAVRNDMSVVAGGTYCGWKHAQSPLHTFEVIYPARVVKKGETWTIEYDCIYFAGLTSLRDVAGNYGIDLQKNVLHIASAVPVNGGKVSLKWANGATELNLPALKPGEVFKFELPSGAADITGTLPGGEKFAVRKMVLSSLKR